MTEPEIIERESRVRSWFTRDLDSIRAEIDGLDIGWGGVQRWATRNMPYPESGVHLDVACGYATFLAELGWRFPSARLAGVNIDFEGAHALAPSLLAEASVGAELIQADARFLPLADASITSWSCFLGLQDVEIGFSWSGVLQTVSEALRVLLPDGHVSVLDHYPRETLADLIARSGLQIVYEAEREPDVRWSREVAERAVSLYAEGWPAQLRTTDAELRELSRRQVRERLWADALRQLNRRGYYVPFGPVRMIVGRKVR